MARTLGKVAGVLLLAVGVAGFFSPRLLGMHLVHVVLGVAFLGVGLVRETSAGYGARSRHPAR